MLGTHPFDKTGGQASDNHTDGFSEHHKHGIVDDEPGNGHVSVHTVLEQIGGHGITETVEEIGADADERQVDPGLVVNQVHEGFEGELLCPDGFQPLFGQKAAGEGAQRSQGAQDNTQDGILVRRRPAHHFLQVRKGEEGDKTHCIGSHHTERGELVALVAVSGHHAQKRAVRYIHGRINQHHQQIQGVGVDPAARRTQIRRIEQQGKHQPQRNGPENEPGPIGAPARPRAVCNGAHQRVCHHVEKPGQQHQGAGIGHGEAVNVGEKERERDGHYFPGNTAGSGISQAISYFLR